MQSFNRKIEKPDSALEQQKFSQIQKGELKTILSLQMQKSLQILQMPIAEMSFWLEGEIFDNPLLELVVPSSLAIPKGRLCEFENFASSPSLFSKIYPQACEIFSKEELHIFETLFANLDSKGFLIHSIEQIAIFLETPKKQVEKVRESMLQFSPIGLGSLTLQEFLLFKCRLLFPEQKEWHQLIAQDFQLLLNKEFQLLKKTYSLSEKNFQHFLNILRKHIGFSPLHFFSTTITPMHFPDMMIKNQNGSLSLSLPDEILPTYKLQKRFFSLLAKEKRFLKRYYTHYRWLERTLEKRKNLLEKIGNFILTYQKQFFLQQGPIAPLSIEECSKKLSIHPSTFRRALYHKYLHCELGSFALIRFFPPPPLLSCKGVSSQQLTLEIINLIEHENKEKPLNDDEIRKKLADKGISISRRTVAKHRQKKQIPTSGKRKKTKSIK